ncbi:hypothetical protein ABEF95_013220 [Exophiala dermatitidis]
MSRSRSRSRQVLGGLALTTLGIGYGTHLYLSSLERRYPALPPEMTTTKILRVPDDPKTQRCAYVDVFAARVPLRKLLRRSDNNDNNNASSESTSSSNSTHQDLALVWAQRFLDSRIMRMERDYFGLPKLDLASSEKLRDAKEGDWSLGEVRVVRRSSEADAEGSLFQQRPSKTSTSTASSNNRVNAVLFCWRMPDDPRLFFEKLAAGGYPWRLMSGGRHELNVELLDDDGEEPMVEVRFAAAHDYQIVPAEGDRQKIIPGWVMRLHRGFGRFVLDQAVKEL